MYWANFLHIYQPPTQTRKILERVTSEAYRRIMAELKRAPQAKLTLNITGGLTELLVESGFSDVVEDLKFLVERGQVELTESAIYHPLLPRLPEEEVVRQIKLNNALNKKYFGEVYQPRGFFPPEAAYDRRIAKIVAGLGYEWILAEELSYNGQFGSVNGDRVYEVADSEAGSSKLDNPISSFQSQVPASSHQPPASRLKIFFRERKASFKILSGQLGTVKLFEDELGERLNRDEYLLTAMDGETFGHHRPGMEKLLFEIYRSPRIKTVTISALPLLFEKRETIETRASTWALMEKDMEKNMPFSRWADPENEIQAMQWELTDLAIASVRKSKFEYRNSKQIPNSKFSNSKPRSLENLNFENSNLFRISDLGFRISDRDEERPMVEQEQWLEARQMLDRALHSDQYWWASARPWWSLEMVERGAKELMEVVLAVPDASETEKQRSRDLYRDIIFTGFEWQRTGKVEEISHKEDEEIRERTDVGLPKLPKEELQKMIGNIEMEMLEVAKKQEYERAAQLRDRIEELKGYMAQKN